MKLLIILLCLITNTHGTHLKDLDDVTFELYELIIDSASEGKLHVDFNVDMLLLKNKLQPLIHRKKVIEFLEYLFPTVKYSHHGMNKLGYITYRASWKPEDYIDYQYPQFPHFEL